jgi:chitinase
VSGGGTMAAAGTNSGGTVAAGGTAGSSGTVATAGTGGSGSCASTGSGFTTLVSEGLFNSMFPTPPRVDLYTYQGLVTALEGFPAFANTGTTDDQKREVAAFLANLAHESGNLQYVEELNPAHDYCQDGIEGCACAEGKQYFGRGPIQLSYTANYCAAGAALGVDLVQQPELVSTDAAIAWGTGVWFWMTQGWPNPTPHDAITGGSGFGATIRSINGSIECTTNGTPPSPTGQAQQAHRISLYKQFCDLLCVTYGDNLSC